MSYTNWIIRVGDGENFKISSKYKIWGVKSTTSGYVHFTNNVKKYDKLWFVLNKDKEENDKYGKLLAVATYISHNERLLGDLINLSMTDEELGWVQRNNIDSKKQKNKKDIWDIEINYEKLYVLDKYDMYTNIKGQTTIREYSEEQCDIDLITEYKYIIKYSNISSEF